MSRISASTPNSSAGEKELKQPVRNQYERLNTSEDQLAARRQEEDPGCCTCLICCFGCLSLCGCRDWVCRKLVFFPPHCQYMVQVEVTEKGLSSIMKNHVMYVRDETGRFSDPHGGAHFKVYMIPTKMKQKICTIFIRNPGAKSTFLISHGNATDLGLLRNHLLELSMVLDVNVYAYDYTGYGLSTNSGRPTVRDCLADIEAAYQHLTHVIGIEEKDVILYGQSLGTGPTLHLARKHPVRAVVLHSGIMSGLRVRNKSNTTILTCRPHEYLNIANRVQKEEGVSPQPRLQEVPTNTMALSDTHSTNNRAFFYADKSGYTAPTELSFMAIRAEFCSNSNSTSI
mmetsp:Transcript_33876/g.47248  ORF Transcript_33876/g.47248 Transcript_33876/m.47248 type:complete len:342 (+) Transcript_33876:87-1112(+)